jgi:hypothetical protein
MSPDLMSRLRETLNAFQKTLCSSLPSMKNKT